MQQLRQLGEVHRHPPRLVLGEQLGRWSSAGLLLEIEIAERLPGAVADDEAAVVCLLVRPGWQEAARGGTWGDDRAISDSTSSNAAKNGPFLRNCQTCHATNIAF